MRKNYCIYIFIFSVILLNILVIANVYKTIINQNNYFRLHIVANSNSIDDQILKLKVSKKLTNYLEKLLKNNNTINKTDSKKIIVENINQILEIANNEIKTNNINYTAYANIGKISYEKKYSDSITMDKGIYDSIQIVLGDGKGENFWSLIFPYSYNSNIIENNNNTASKYIDNTDIEIKSGFFEDIKKVVKFFS